MAVEEVRLPELGENIETADVVSVRVSVGESIEKDQTLIEVETEKAAVEIPSPLSGVVKDISVKEGDKLKVGEVILTLETGAGDTQEEGDGGKPAEATEGEPAEATEGEPARAKRGQPTQGREEESAAGRKGEPEEEVAAQVEDREGVVPEPIVERESAKEERLKKEEPGKVVPAGPAVRRLARELGIDIGDVKGSGPKEGISLEDVKRHAKQLIGAKARQPGAPSMTASRGVDLTLPDFTRWGEIERKPMSSLRRKAADTTSTSWSVIPHVTQFDCADITELERERRNLGKKVEAAGGKLTVTAIIIKVTASALRLYPQFNASLDMQNEEIIYKKYVNIGVAVDTERGLIVPVIRDVDRKNLTQISVELGDLAARARDKKITLEEMRGANISVTNLGGLGTTYFSPLVIWPHVAVVGIGRSRTEAVFRDGQFEPRLILPLSISYDHRLVDGADASRFLRWMGEALEQPLVLLVEG
jgi:pyruvate dehydrogenase E2 component (dihydrolipoamide acetyltransferase)